MAAPVPEVDAATAIADFSDNDEVTNQNEASDEEIQTYHKPRGSLAARMAAASAKSIHDDSGSENEDEESKEYTSKAAGFAARMRALSSKPILDSSSSESEEDPRMKGLSARERMKLMLQKEKEPQQPELPKPVSAPNISTTLIHPQSSDGDEEVPVARKPRSRPARTPSPPRDHSPEPTPLSRPAEESLFVSPTKEQGSTAADASDDEGVPDLTRLRGTASFKALIAKKKAEREAREAKEEEERRIRHEKTRELMAEGSSDSEADRAMHGLPNMKKWHDKHGRTKRTSRKTMEEESRETQRMARNMQLAHEITTKKKISKASLFARFNYKAEGMEEEELPSSSPRKVDDMGNAQESDTPATSPLTQQAAQGSREASAKPGRDSAPNSVAEDEDEDLPTMEQILSSSPRKLTAVEKGKVVAMPPLSAKSSPAKVKKTIRVIQPKVTRRASISMDDDSDDGLEIVTRKPIKTKRDMDEIFRNIPAKKEQESGGLHALRLLAHLTSPSRGRIDPKRRNARPIMNPGELAMTLQQKARQQAAREREERLNELRAKGVHIETAEEKEARQNEVIDLVARAREENAAIRKEERRAQKLANVKAGIIDPMDDDSDSDEEEDEDWEEGGRKKRKASVSGSDEEADDEIELSGSEDEEMADEVDAVGGDLIDDAACETENDEDEEMGDADIADLINDEDEDPEPTLPTAASRRRSRKSQIVDSDSEDENTHTVSVHNTPRPRAAQTPATNRFLSNGKSPAVPTSVLRSATKSFIPGMPVTGAVGLGLTQIFAGTMDSQADYSGSPMPSPTQGSPSQTAQDSQQDSLAFLKNLPPPDFTMNSVPKAVAKTVIPSSQVEIDTIPATQEEGDTQFVKLSAESQSQAPEMTQDQGFSTMSPIKGRFSATPAPSVDTVVIAGTPQLPEATPSVIADSITDSPVKSKKGKLRRRTEIAALSEDEDAEPMDKYEVRLKPFETMRRAASAVKKERRAQREREEFDKKKSHAKDMVDEAATESEDEYAGLGGVSGSDSDSDDEELNKAMLDETKISRKDEAGLQALAAQMDRDEDEAQVNKLYRDITTGGIRRKRGPDYDLSDSDDDGEARRRMKRREFAKMRKAMMEDENIGKIVNKPKQAAFLKSLEDREDDGMEDWDEEEIVDVERATNSQLPPDETQDSQEGGEGGRKEEMGPSKRKSEGENPSRMLPAMRRIRHLSDAKRPKSLAEIRLEVSQLLEDPDAIHFGAKDSSDSELEIEDDALSVHEGLLSDDEDIDMEPQDTSIVLGEVSILKAASKEKSKQKENMDPFASRRSSVAVVDRSLSRQNSAASSDGSRLAFAQSSAISSGFKVPPLLRKATGNSLSSATSSFSGEQGTAKLAAAGLGAKMSNKAIGKGFKGFAKEEQRMKVIQEGEKKRTEKRLKGVEERRKTVGGVFGGGRFE